MATQTGSIDLTASNSVKLAAEAGWQSDLEDYATKAELSVQADRIGMVVANNDASSSLQLTADAMTYIGNNVTIKGTDGTTTAISGGRIQANSLSIGAFDSAAQSATLNSNISVGGRNLLQQSWRETQSSVTKSGITYTCNADGSITLNGTSTEMNTFVLAQSMTLSAGTYTLSGCPSGGGTNSYRLDILAVPLVSGTTESVADNGSGVTFETTGGTTGQVRIRVASGQTISNLTFWPKLEKGNIATDWTPAPEDATAYTDDAIDSIEVGGRNLLRNTGNPVASGFALTRATVADGVITITPTTSSAYAKFKVDYLDFDDYGEGEFTVSFDARAVSGATYTQLKGAMVYLGFNVPSRIGNTLSNSYDRYTSHTMGGALTYDWVRYSHTFVVPDDLTSGKAAALASGSNLTVQFAMTGSYAPMQVRNVKLEKGNKATDWTAAPEDVDAAITNAAKTATSYVTDITGGGIMVHPSGDSTTGVKVADSVNIMQDGVSVAEYGETTRIGAESSDHVAIDSNELMFHDGTNAVMQVGGSCQITEKHVCGSSTSEVFYISLKPSDGATFRVIDSGGETVTSNYTLSRSGKRCTLTNKSGTALDGETVLVFYQSSGMVLYDEGDVSSTFATDQASLAGGMFEMSYEDFYSSVDGTLTDSTAEISIGKHRDQYSSISLNATPSGNRSYVTFQAKGNGYAAFVLDSGSTSDPERTLDLIYLDRINYADPYGGSDRQLGVPTRLTASGSYTAGTADTMGPHVTLTAGIWLIDGIWNFANSSSDAKRLTIGLYRSSTGTAFTYRVHTTASSNSAHRLEVVDFIVVSAASETVTLYGASSPASTSATTQFITSVRLA